MGEELTAKTLDLVLPLPSLPFIIISSMFSSIKLVIFSLCADSALVLVPELLKQLSSPTNRGPMIH